MSGERVRCMFCYMDTGDAISASHEHLISKPVAAAFGIDRTAPVARMNSDGTDLRWRPINGIKRRVVCTDCNNGWMNRLEHRMGAIASWLNGPPDDALGDDRERDLRMWAMKTHMLLCYIDGNADRFGDDGFDGEYVVPPVTPAREMYEGDEESLRRAGVGLARCSAQTDFAWAFGFPTVRTTGPGGGHARFAPASVLTVGSLQLWVVIPLRDASVSIPSDVMPSQASIRPRDLLDRDHPKDVGAVVVDFG